MGFCLCLPSNEINDCYGKEVTGVKPVSSLARAAGLAYHASMALLTAPPRLTLSDSYQAVGIWRELVSADSVELDLGNCQRWDAAMVAMLSLGFAKRRSLKLPVAKVSLPRDTEVVAFLDELEFRRFLEGRGSAQDAGPQRGTLALRHLTSLDRFFVEEAGDLIAERVPGTSVDVAHLVQLCLNELLQNVFEHAASLVGCVVAVRWHAAGGNARISVVDAGIGIPAALRRVQERGLQRGSDEEAIIAAVTSRGVSSRRTGRFGGLGLKTLHELATERGGQVTVLSHAAKVAFRKDRVQPVRSPHFLGTLVEIDFRPAQEVRGNPAQEIF